MGGCCGVKVSVPKVSVPKISVPKVSVPKISVPKVTVPKVTVPKVSVPKISVPKISLPKVDIKLPAVNLPSLPTVKLPTGLDGIRLPGIDDKLFKSITQPLDQVLKPASQLLKPASDVMNSVAKVATDSINTVSRTADNVIKEGGKVINQTTSSLQEAANTVLAYAGLAPTPKATDSDVLKELQKQVPGTTFNPGTRTVYLAMACSSYATVKDSFSSLPWPKPVKYECDKSKDLAINLEIFQSIKESLPQATYDTKSNTFKYNLPCAVVASFKDSIEGVAWAVKPKFICDKDVSNADVTSTPKVGASPLQKEINKLATGSKANNPYLVELSKISPSDPKYNEVKAQANAFNFDLGLPAIDTPTIDLSAFDITGTTYAGYEQSSYAAADNSTSKTPLIAAGVAALGAVVLMTRK